MIWNGIQALQSVKKVRYFRMRHERLVQGWRMILSAIVLVVVAFWLGNYGEPVAYMFYKPSVTPSLSPTITLTPTISLTPTITPTPSITRTPAISNTPSPTSTPFIPPEIKAKYTSVVTPNPASLFSPLVFARGIDLTTYKAIDSGTVFQNPIKRMVAIYSYDNMTDGVQWTALWYRDGTLVNAETKPWTDGTGGYGYTDWAPDPSAWLPGNYEVQIFVGLEWKIVNRFTVQGKPPAPRPTLRPTATITMTPTPSPYYSPTVSRTPLPSATRQPTNTRPPTLTPVPSLTRPPTSTPTISPMPSITRTRIPTDTPWPIPTATITLTRLPTSTPRPTDTAWAK